eukprot:CAMPEP_0174854772 /NCGR_PEP_ID=MMETSP1114-20130205/31940_1 /TAXON_ID=312471 /ORGANISM="Neobodo designis, Strain CCAP 1951/1" /LENGTH=637 /DNA_ID=CAMNT_0016089481 /DNA_START=111 /DNA_END=2024 /DNA_ORIENTATION=+
MTSVRFTDIRPLVEAAAQERDQRAAEQTAAAAAADGDGAAEAEPTPKFTVAPIARSGAAAFVHQGRVFLYGGLHGETELLNDVCCYDMRRQAWIELDTRCRPGSRSPQGSFGSCTTQLRDGSFFILGGQSFHREPLRCAHIFNPTTMTWEQCRLFAAHSHLPRATAAVSPALKAAREVCRWGATMHPVPKRWWGAMIPREICAVKDVADCILLVAGDTDDSKRDLLALWRTQNQPDRWTVKQVNPGHPQFMPRRRHVSALYRNEFLLVFSGRCFLAGEDFTTEFTNDFWVYSLSANMWGAITPNTPPVLVQQLFAAGAYNSPPEEAKRLIALQRSLLYAIAPAPGREVPPPRDGVAWPPKRTGASGMLVGDRFVVMTGFWFDIDSEESRMYNDVWSFSLSTCRWQCIREHKEIRRNQLRAANAEAGTCVGPYPHSMSAFVPIGVSTVVQRRPPQPAPYDAPSLSSPSTSSSSAHDDDDFDRFGTSGVCRTREWKAFLSGGRFGDMALEENFMVSITEAPPTTLTERIKRHIVHKRLLQLHTQAEEALQQRRHEVADEPAGPASRQRKRLTPKVVKRLVNDAVSEMVRFLPASRKGAAASLLVAPPSDAGDGGDIPAFLLDDSDLPPDSEEHGDATDP